MPRLHPEVQGGRRERASKEKQKEEVEKTRSLFYLFGPRPRKKRRKKRTHPEHLVDLPRHLQCVLGPRDQAVDCPRQHRGGGLVPRDQQSHQVVPQLLRVEGVARGQQKVQDGRVLVAQELVDKLLLARVDEALALCDKAVERRVDYGQGFLAAPLPRHLDVFLFGGEGSRGREKTNSEFFYCSSVSRAAMVENSRRRDKRRAASSSKESGGSSTGRVAQAG